MNAECKAPQVSVVSRPEPTCGARVITPRVDITENASELTLYAEMPGVSSDQVQLHFEKGELILLGKTAPREIQGTLLLDEAPHGDFHRVFSVDESIDAMKITAEYKQGVLVIHLPKAESARSRQIEVKAG